MKSTFQQIRFPVILLLCFALIFQPELAAQAHGYYESTGRKDYVYTPKLDNINEVDSQISYTYDELGRLETVQVEKLNGEDANDQTEYYYNEVGSLKGVFYPNNNYAAYSYDELNRLTNLANKNASQEILSSYQYTLAPDGQSISVAEFGGKVIDWKYDNLNRLTKEQYNAPGDANDYSHSYVYDLVGNRLERQVLDGNDTIYHYNNNDQLKQETTDGNNIYYGYDDNGSLIEEANDVSTVRIYSYNLQNRLASVDNGNDIVNYKYNPDGIRVQSSVIDGTTTNYLIDPYNHTGYAQVFRANIVDGASTVYVLGNDVLAQATSADEPDYFLYDGHGSVRQLANSSGSIIQSYNFDAYGNALFDSSNASTHLLYAGEQFDSSLGWYYNRARYYIPQVGRFNRLDPFSGNNHDPQSLHKYLYAHCNPINNIDPSGNFTLTRLTATIMISAIIANIGLTVYSGIRHNLSASVIVWQVVQNLAFFGAIAGAILLSGPIAIVAGGLLVIATVKGIIDLVRSWPEMDTIDKIVAAATMLTFLAFAGAVRAGVAPKVPSSSSFKPGDCSKLPESYYSKTVVNMKNAPKTGGTTALGYPRNNIWFWKKVRNISPEYFSKQNLTKISNGRAPIVDATWIKHHTQHMSFMGEKLVHHHIGQGQYAVGVPEPIHLTWSRVLHTKK